MEDIYQKHILDHFQHPYNCGRLERATVRHVERNRVCGDQVELQLLVGENGRVLRAFFDGMGCAISRAAASILCRQIEGKSLDELRNFEATRMLDLLNVPLPPRRQQCGLLAFKALKAMVDALGVSNR